MSDLLSLLLERRSPFGNGAHVADVQIKFAELGAWKELRRHSLIEAGLYEAKTWEDFEANFLSDYAVAMVETTGSHILIQFLLAPKDPIRSHKLLTSGTVVAKGKADTSAFISALVEHLSSPYEFRNFVTDANTEGVEKIEGHEFFVLVDFNEAETFTERRIIERANELIGNTEKAEAWFNYQPLSAFDNKTPRQLVEEGRSDAVLLHLDTLEDGVYA